MVGEGEEGKMGGGGGRRGVREEGRQRENSGDEATYMYTYIHCMAPYAGCVWVSPCQSATTQSRLTRGQYLLPNRECWQTAYSAGYAGRETALSGKRKGGVAPMTEH